VLDKIRQEIERKQETYMPEVIFPGPEGRLEGRYHPQKERDAPIASSCIRTRNSAAR